MNTPKTLTTFTLKSLKDFHACETGYDTLVGSLPADFPEDQPINLLAALASNPAQDVFWALRAVAQDISHLIGPLSADAAEAVLPIFERAYPNDNRPRQAIEAVRSGNPDAAAAASAAAADAYAADARADFDQTLIKILKTYFSEE